MPKTLENKGNIKKYDTMNHYFSDNRRFADLFNTVLFHEDIVIPEELSDAAEVYHELETKKSLSGTKNRRKERIRDVCKTLKTGEILRILALENMELVDYSAPFRCIQYDMMEYSKQLDILKKKNRLEDNLVTPSERICGLRQTDRLMPIYTICLYHGAEKWDGPRSLQDMMCFGDSDDRFRQTFNDYPFHLYCLNEADDLEQFHTEVGVLFRVLQFRKDRKGLKQLLQNNVEYRQVDTETLEAMAVLLDMPSIWAERDRYMIQNEDDREEYDMCLAVREWAEEERNIGRKEGRKEGHRQGAEDKAFSVVKNLLSRGFSEEEIMLIAECDQKFVIRVKNAM